MCMCVCVCACVCVFVCERESVCVREREKESESERVCVLHTSTPCAPVPAVQALLHSATAKAGWCIRRDEMLHLSI